MRIWNGGGGGARRLRLLLVAILLLVSIPSSTAIAGAFGLLKDAVRVGKTVSDKIDVLVDTIVTLEESIQDVKNEIKDVRAEIKEVKTEIKEMKVHVSRLSLLGVIAGTFVLTKYGSALLPPLLKVVE